MSTATVGALFDRTATVLESLRDRYQSLAQQFEHGDTLMAEFAAFLATREHDTVTALEEYRADEHPVALDVHVRLSAGFPDTADDLQVPEHPTLDELAELAERTDTLLERLSERIKVYAASPRLAEILAALEQLVATRRHRLAGALNEYDEFSQVNSQPT